jgi:tripartite-type tricarboxylate transporter receptor subunit TctC
MPHAPRWRAERSLAAFLLVLATTLTAAQADPVADFYRGKTVNVLIGVGVGGEYDLQARLVARHIGKHIPGNPTVVAQNMTGAGGLKMTNYLATIAPRDGTHIGMIQNAFPALQAAFDVTMKDSEFLAEAKKFNFEVDPVRGEDLQKVVDKVLGSPKTVAARAKALLE